MNGTNQSNNGSQQIPPLKARCNRIGIHIPGENPTPAEIIPVIERRLAAHMLNHDARTASQYSGDFVEWKLIHDEYQEFLTALRAAASQNAAQSQHTINPPKVGPAVPSGPPSVQSPSSNPPTSSVQAAQPPTKKNPPTNPTGTELPPATQQPAPESEVSSAELLPSSAESQLTSAESQLTSAESQLTSAESQLTSSELNSPNANPASDTGTTTPKPKLEPVVNVSDYLNAASQQACADLQEYLSGRSPLDDLSPQQQQAVILLLNDYSAQRVAEIIAQPPPLGFNIKLTDASILRFRDRLRAARSKAARDSDEKARADLLAEAQQSEEAFQGVIRRLIKDRLVRAATSPMTCVSNIDSLITSLTKLRKQGLADREQALAERKQLHAEKMKPSRPEKH